MNSIRLISRLDVKGPNVVKGVHSEGLRVVGKPSEMASAYFSQGVDEIVYMDIVASLYDRNLDFAQLKAVCENVFIPFTVGGGIRTLGDVNDALRAGADKVAINTAAVRNPSFLHEAALTFGSQCIVLSVETKKIRDGFWEAYVEGGREKTGLNALEWIRQTLNLGIGEVMLTSIDQDGTRKGYDLELIRQVTEFARVPVIVHGGAGSPEHVVEVINEARADAVSASSIYHYGEYQIGDVRSALTAKHIPTRQL